ncbi:lipoprotein [Williamsoniiplasma lucivorax]|nr:lipoprotein [Williamsoniiplasma lucivorax]
MKKLLTLLGSVGMVAATAATVVACNKNETKADIEGKVGEKKSFDLPKDLLKDYKEPKATEVVAKEKTPMLGDIKIILATATTPAKLEFTPTAAGETEIKIEGKKGDATEFTEIKKFSVKVAANVKDLKDLGAVVIKVGMDKAAIETAVQTEVVKLAKDAKLTTDYTIEGIKPQLVAGEKITVKHVEGSKLLSGKQEITIVAADTSAVKSLENLGAVVIKVGMNQAAIETAVQTEVVKLAKDAKLTTDYTIEGIKTPLVAGEKITVKHAKDSKLLTGQKEITIVAADTSAVKSLENLGAVVIKVGMNQAAIETAVQTEVVKLAKDAKLTTDYTIEGIKTPLVAGETITVKHVAGSKLLTSQKVITIAAAA